MRKSIFVLLVFVMLIGIPFALIVLSILVPSYYEPIIHLDADFTPEKTKEIALRHAPFFLQETKGGNPDLCIYEYICRMDFDGDFEPRNNAAHVAHERMKAAVYYSLLATDSHYFLTYSIFHPLEGNYRTSVDKWYENGMENLQVVVSRDPSETGGKVELIALQRTKSVDFYRTAGSSFEETSLKFEKETALLADDTGRASDFGTHPVIVVRSGRHILQIPDTCREIFLDRDRLALLSGIVYAPSDAEEGEVPVHVQGEGRVSLKSGQKVSYALLDTSRELWDEDVRNRCFEDYFEYKDRYDLTSPMSLPSRPVGEQYNITTGNVGLAPFALGRGIRRGYDGVLFFNPLVIYRNYFVSSRTLSRRYVYFPYVAQ